MPNYLYRCKIEYCKNEFETQQSMTSSPLTFCEVCQTESLERVIHAAYGFVRGEPKTVGHLAHRNTESLSSMELSERTAKSEAEKMAVRSEAAKAIGLPADTKAPKVPVNKKLANLTAKQADVYVQTGKLP